MNEVIPPSFWPFMAIYCLLLLSSIYNLVQYELIKDATDSSPCYKEAVHGPSVTLTTSPEYFNYKINTVYVPHIMPWL